MQMLSLNSALNLPEWYRLERETEKTIGRLVNLKELDYYLRNPDEYLRRLALIRLSELKPRDCENIISQILEDHYESNENKELAAWVLKATALKLNIDIFINNRYLTKFTGNEKLKDIYKITCDELQPSLRFNFSSNKVCSQIPASEDSINNCQQSVVLNSVFSFRQWLSSISGNMLSRLKLTMISFLKLFIKIIGWLLQHIFIRFPSLLFRSIKKCFKRREHSPTPKSTMIIPDNSNYCSRLNSKAYNNPDLMPLVMKSRKPFTYRPSVVSSLVSVVKKVVLNMLYVFFFPVRLFLKHKLALVIILLALYVFLNFTNQGSILFKEYTGKEFLQFQTTTVNEIKEFSISSWNSFTDFTGLNKMFTKDAKKAAIYNDPGVKTAGRYSVTASKGLNIRQSPDPNSEKITGGSLAFGSIVTFLDKIMTDSAGRTWYYVKAEDGRSGWVSAKYLTIIKEG